MAGDGLRLALRRKSLRSDERERIVVNREAAGESRYTYQWQ
jgi:hypothetical protein